MIISYRFLDSVCFCSLLQRNILSTTIVLVFESSRNDKICGKGKLQTEMISIFYCAMLRWNFRGHLSFSAAAFSDKTDFHAFNRQPHYTPTYRQREHLIKSRWKFRFAISDKAPKQFHISITSNPLHIIVPAPVSRIELILCNRVLWNY